VALAMIYPEPKQGKQRDPELQKKLLRLGKLTEEERTELRENFAVVPSWNHGTTLRSYAVLTRAA
jgi:hypothetical protein